MAGHKLIFFQNVPDCEFFNWETNLVRACRLMKGMDGGNKSLTEIAGKHGICFKSPES